MTTKPTFNLETDIPSLDGKVAIVTGIGKITALELAKKGCHVFLFGRSAEKTLPVIEEIKKESKNDKVEFLEADLMDLGQVEQAADQFLARGLPLHILINNAGIMYQPFHLTANGMESQIATNHFAHAVLTNKLLSAVESSSPSRIVNISSLLHQTTYLSGINYDTWCDEKKYNAEMQYGVSKLLNIHFTNELQERLDEKSKKEGKECQVYVNTVHPGVVKSNLLRNQAHKLKIVDMLYNWMCIPAEHGAITQLYVATSPDIQEKKIKGKYFVPFHQMTRTSGSGADENGWKKTWEWTGKELAAKYREDWKWNI
ncbi:hypothetical protein HDV01_001446 [Terramyces sp. JEL0728]|nr:hypothetical protein HDV01_001446 [Terramyces sp. JEL0728]